MARFLVVLVVLSGCGPFAPNDVGRTCDAGVGVQHCASPTTYAACDLSGPTGIWREYPCGDTCTEGKECPLKYSKPGSACAPSWTGPMLCQSVRYAVTCIDGGWSPRPCSECPPGETCFSCTCQ